MLLAWPLGKTMSTPELDPRGINPPPKAFISYALEDSAHKHWVRQLATRLRADGVDVMLDQWNAAPGDQIPAFMELAVRENDFVIAICTPQFKEKSDARAGGVGYEGDIMTAYAFAERGKGRFIPVLRKGTWSEAAPTWLTGRARIDLTGDPYQESEYEDLLRTLHGAREKAPPIGPPPDFVDTKESTANPGSALAIGLRESYTPQSQSSAALGDELLVFRAEERARRNIDELRQVVSWQTEDEIKRVAHKKYIPHLYVRRETEILLSQALFTDVTLSVHTRKSSRTHSRGSH